MSDHENDRKTASRPLSEISHLFLSGIRDQAGGENRARPVRVPPTVGQRPAAPEAPTMRMSAEVDLTPEEFAGVFGNAAPPPAPAMIVGAPIDGNVARRRRVTAVFGAGAQSDGVADAALAYAASLAARDERIGVIALDGVECRVQCVACEPDDSAADDADLAERVDARELTDALTELNHDVDRWLVVLGDPRRADAREALCRADDWTMLSTCDHDGIVSGYRALKGLAEAGAKSPLSIALTDAPDAMQANKVYAKLAGVCRQFLDWDVRHETLEDDVEHASVRTAYRAQARADSTSSRAAWSAIGGLLALAPDAAADEAHYGDRAEVAPAAKPLVIPPIARPIAALPSIAPIVEAPVPIAEVAMPIAEPTLELKPITLASPAVAAAADDEIIDLPAGTSILAAVLKAGTQLLATPIAPPMCPGATIAVDRDRALVLVAQAGDGLAGVDAIAAAVRWLDESKQLVAMAMPQLAIDASLATRVLLLVDQADRAAIAVRPLFAGSDGRVSVRSYRRLRWAGRVGLLLEAA